jgi:transcriptional regulator with XRE-family HTH domain
VRRVPAPPAYVLRNLIEKRSWSQKEVERRSGLSRAKVSGLFNQDRERIDGSTLQALADAFNVPRDWLYGSGHDNGRRPDARNLEVYHSLGCALKAEFRGSSLRGNVAKASRILTTLLQSNRAPAEITTHFTPSDEILKRGPLTGLADPGAALHKALKGRPVSVATNAMECGTVAALLRLRERLHDDGVELKVDYSRVHGGDLVRGLNTGKEFYDFGVLGFSPMYLDLAIYVGRSDYFLLTPVHVASQCVYAASPERDRLKRVYYLEGGSGELQTVWADGGQGELGQAAPDFEAMRDRRTFSAAKDMETEAGVIAYSALGATLEEQLGLKPVGNTGFDIHVCLFAHREGIGKNPAVAKAFTVAFSRAYDDCATRQEIARRHLWNDCLYLSRYASGAKMTLTED